MIVSLVTPSAVSRLPLPTPATAWSRRGCGPAARPRVARVPAQRLEHRHALQRRVPGHVEDHRVPRRGRDLVGVLRQAACPGTRPGCPPAARRRRSRPRRRSTSMLDPAAADAAGGTAPSRAARRDHWMSIGAQPVVGPAPGRRARGSPRSSCELGHPVDLARALHRVALEPGRARRAHRCITSAVSASGSPAYAATAGSGRRARGTPRAAPRAVIRRPSRSSMMRLQRRVVRDLRAASRPAWLTARSSVIARSSIIASTRRGRAELEQVGDVAVVGVADDDVQPAVEVGDRVRLVAGVDDRPLQRRLQPDLDLEEVGALG